MRKVLCGKNTFPLCEQNIGLLGGQKTGLCVPLTKYRCARIQVLCG